MELRMRLRWCERIRMRRRQDEGQKESGIYSAGTAAEGAGNLRGELGEIDVGGIDPVIVTAECP